MLKLSSIESSIDEFEHFLVGIAAKIAPWAADLPVAYLAARNIIDMLQWHPAIGWIAAAAVEALGLACTSTALEFADYNATRNSKQPPAPTGLAWAMVGVYFGSSLVLSLLATFTGLELFAILVWPVISSVGTLVHAMRKDHARRLAANEQVKAQAREDRERRKADKALAQAEAIVEQATQEVAQPLPQLSKRDQVLDYFLRNPLASQQEAANVIGISRQAVGQHLQGLEKAGAIKRNGHGVQVA